MSAFPSTTAARDRWILQQRPPRNDLDPWIPYAFQVEPEAGPDGRMIETVTIFLTNRECPWHCLMCDLWRNTMETTVPAGAIAAQIQHALDRLPPITAGPAQIKLYNAGSFFDPRAIPPAEYPEIARLSAPFQRVVVECHPALVGHCCREFRDLLPGRLEVAMGLETVHPNVLPRLNKRMTLEQFRRAARWLAAEGIDLRVFLLLRPPWLSEQEGVDWAKRTLDFAFDCGASVCTLIPTRAGNGAMEALMASGEFAPPTLASLESVLEYGLARRDGRVFADLWDIENLIRCPDCSRQRIDRLRAMNASQTISAPIVCPKCSDPESDLAGRPVPGRVSSKR